MKYIITESQFENGAIFYLNQMYGDFEEYKTDKYPNRVFYVKDKKVYMEHDLKEKELTIDFSTIWADLRDIFDLDSGEADHIIIKWAKQTYDIINVTPYTRIVWEQLDL